MLRTLASLLFAVHFAALLGTAPASAQRAIDPGTSPWTLRGAQDPLELGELRLPDVRDRATIDLAELRGGPLLLIEFASW